MGKGSKFAVQADEEAVSVSGNRVLKKRERGLERLLGRKTTEVEILEGPIEIASETTDFAHAVALQGGYAAKQVAEVLDVARSQLFE